MGCQATVGDVEKKGADKGIDGIITFTDARNRLESVLVSVKSGGVNASHIRDLIGTMERKKAAVGLFITLEEPTAPMRQEAATAGMYHSELWNRDFPRVQLLSIRDLLESGKRPNLPSFVMPTYQRDHESRLRLGSNLPLENPAKALNHERREPRRGVGDDASPLAAHSGRLVRLPTPTFDACCAFAYRAALSDLDCPASLLSATSKREAHLNAAASVTITLMILDKSPHTARQRLQALEVSARVSRPGTAYRAQDSCGIEG
jgi:hypothetical protein